MLCCKVLYQLFLILGLFTYTTYTRTLDAKLKRSRRQAADVKLAEYSARMAIERARQGCQQIGCGLIDLIQSGKKKRADYSEEDARDQLLKLLLDVKDRR